MPARRPPSPASAGSAVLPALLRLLRSRWTPVVCGGLLLLLAAAGVQRAVERARGRELARVEAELRLLEVQIREDQRWLAGPGRVYAAEGPEDILRRRLQSHRERREARARLAEEYERRNGRPRPTPLARRTEVDGP